MKPAENILLVLDLDETLLHSSEKKLALSEDFQYAEYYVYFRPHLQWFLEEMNLHFSLAIWSSADDTYVNDLVAKITPKTVNFEFIWGKSRCTPRRNYEFGNYVFAKHLKKLKKKGFSLEKILIIDDSPEKTKDNYGNAVYITPFEGNREDVTLKKLANYLISIKDAENVRTIEKRGWLHKNTL
ncbi:HAD family hydrolase [Kordia algicida OT-1]|uniref:Phosphoprotein phosphatase n=1 Tax=Kordia algicida OT-1 TaxID=391587 RepID=A9DVZ1_9FLAO|nr:HAD family hydrolase [Kordia algicida]EDP96486.1 phosphoprotein phosphatase [Kordia algicida OT-1]